MHKHIIRKQNVCSAIDVNYLKHQKDHRNVDIKLSHIQGSDNRTKVTSYGYTSCYSWS